MAHPNPTPAETPDAPQPVTCEHTGLTIPECSCPACFEQLQARAAAAR
jgi:hypothetical protein